MDLLDRLLDHDDWATREVLNLASGMPDSHLDREFDFAHRTVRRTLDHLIWNIECWTDLISGNDVRSRPPERGSVDDLTKRHASASAVFRRLARQIIDSDRCDELFVDSLDDPPVEKSLGGVIAHLPAHGMHHRAHLLIMLRRLGVPGIPELDPLTWESRISAGPDN